MTMFEELYALACSVSLNMTVSADPAAGRLTVNVIPRPKPDANEPALSQPLSLTATPREFDEGFVDALRGFREVRKSLAQQAETTQVVLEAARAASSRKANEAGAKAKAARSAMAKGVPAIARTAPADGADDEATEPAVPSAPMPTGQSYELFG